MKINQIRLKRTAGILRVVFDVFFWVTAAMAAASLFFLIVTFFMPDNFFTMSGAQGMGISLDGVISFKIDPVLYGGLNLKPFIQAVIPMLMIVIAMIEIIMNQVGKILKTVVQDLPFDRKNPKRLLTIGAVLMAGSVFFRFVECRAVSILIDLLGLNNIDITYSADVTLLLTGFLILIFAGVFQYGSYLQEEYDATL